MALLLATLVMLGGCSSGDPGIESAADTAVAVRDSGVSGTRAPSTERGGTLRAVAPAVDSLDPARSYLPWVWNLMRLYTRTLVTYDSAPGSGGTELVPDLATTLGVPADNNQTWTYTLRPGTMFESGRPITAQDVKYGIERSFASEVIVGGPLYVVSLLDDPESPYPGPYFVPERGDRPILTSIETPDASTLVFHLNRPYAAFDEVMALPSSSPVPAEADTGADYGLAPQSSGPYRVTSVDPVTGIVLERNPNWDQASDEVRTARPDRVEVRTGVASVERDQRILGGSADLDLGGGVAPESLDRVLGDTETALRTDQIATGALQLLAMPATVAPFDNPACRLAVAAAVDVSAIQDALGGAALVQPPRGLWPRTLNGNMPEVSSAAPVDIAEVGRQLAACGLPGGFSTVIAAPNQARSLAVADVIRANLQAVGIEATVAGLDPATYYAADIGSPASVVANQYGILLTRWSADFPDPASFLGPLVDGREITAAGNTNVAQLDDPTINGLVDAAYAAPDDAAALTAWETVAQTVTGSGSYVPLLEERTVLLAGERLRNAVVHWAYGGYDLATVAVR
ncbi:MAG: ABC transporter substrate-binding protein [Actinomycetota bacterium]|nr:ABC transporter substrate-binding protein [Actinomycetota bacterium]